MAQRIIETGGLKAWRAREAYWSCGMCGEGWIGSPAVTDHSRCPTCGSDEIERDAPARKAIVIERTSQGWVAAFYGVEGMPSGEPLPLPFTSLTSEHTVRAHMVAHFPGASVRAIQPI